LIALQADYGTVVEDRPIMSVNIVSQFQSSTFGQNERTPQRGFCAIAEHLVFFWREISGKKLAASQQIESNNSIKYVRKENNVRRVIRRLR